MLDTPTNTLKIGHKQLLDQANREVRAIAPRDALPLLDHDGTVFVDIRDVRELERDGKIPGAYHAPRGMLEFWVDPDCKYHKEIFSSGKNFVFYCASAWRSALSAKTLQDMGLPGVSHLEGGFSAWKDAGLPTAQHKPKEHKPKG